MPGTNEQLRRAREKLPSWQTPGGVLSRQELAEQVNRWIFIHTDRIVELDDNYVGKLERGVIRWPCRLYRSAFRAVLHAGADAELGFYRRRRSATVTDMDRKQFVQMSSAVLALPWLDLFGPNQPTTPPQRVGAAEVEQVRTAAKVFCNWDNSYGGGLGREAVFAHLRWSARLLHADCSEPFRPALFAAVANLATVAGFMAVDGYAHEDAQRAHRFGLACAEESGDRFVRAWLLGNMALEAIWYGRPDDGLTLADNAMVRADQLTAGARARLHTVRARALAKMGRAQECHAAVGASDEEMDHSSPNDVPAWAPPHDRAWHQSLNGQALFDLSIAGQHASPASRLSYAVAHYAPDSTRSRAVARVKLASLAMATGDPREAVAVGHMALDGIDALRSRRTVDDMRELHRLAGRHMRITEVADLRERIGQTLNHQPVPAAPPSMT